MVFSYMWVHKVEIPAKRVQTQHLMVKTSHWLEHLTQHHTQHNYNFSIHHRYTQHPFEFHAFDGSPMNIGPKVF